MTSERKVLVIDDEEDHLLICKLVLEHRGFEVITLRGTVTLDQIFETIYSFWPLIIFTEKDMPGVTCEQIAGMVRQVPQFHHLRVICLSALANADAVKRIPGLDDFLAKPLVIHELLGILIKYTGEEGQ